MHNTVFFLGANAPGGFCSLFGELQTAPVTRFHILKGGPGNGKSTYLRTIADAAEAAGMDTERILCASDPGSLDGLYLPQIGHAWVDGTSPHVAEPALPGARDIYVNLGALWDPDRLEAAAGELEPAFAAYAALHRDAARWIRAAGEVYEAICALPEDVQTEKLQRRARGIALREFGRKAERPGRLRRRFLSALTPQGPMCLYDTAFDLCGKIYVLEDPMGMSDPMLTLWRDAALEAGFDVCVCGHPLMPEKTAHLLVPEAGVGFVTSDAVFRCPREGARHLHMDTLQTGSAAQKRRFRSHRRLLRTLLAEAAAVQREAGELHRHIEALYNPGVDFEALHAAASNAAEEAVLRWKNGILGQKRGIVT